MQKKIKVGIITQEDPFFLAETISYLFSRLPKDHIEIVVAVVFSGSPFGKKLAFKDKALNTLKIFGLRFFIHYALRFILYKLNPRKSVRKTLKTQQISIITDIENINTDIAINRIMDYEPDLLVSIGGNQIFEKRIIQAAPKGMLNLHTSLLPLYRGLMPTFWVLKSGEKETGVSVFFIDEGIDSGDIIVQKRIPINGQSQAELIKTSKRLGMDALIEAIMAIKTNTVTRISNPDNVSTYKHFPTKSDVKEFYKKGNKFF